MPKRCGGSKGGKPHVVHVTKGSNGTSTSGSNSQTAHHHADPTGASSNQGAVQNGSSGRGTTTGSSSSSRGRGRGRGTAGAPTAAPAGRGRRGGRGGASVAVYDLSDFDLLDELIEQNNAIHAAGAASAPSSEGLMHTTSRSSGTGNSGGSVARANNTDRRNGSSVIIDNRLVDLQRPTSRHGQQNSVAVSTTDIAGMINRNDTSSATVVLTPSTPSENESCTVDQATGTTPVTEESVTPRPRSAPRVGRGTEQQRDINSPQAIAAALRRLHENDGVMEDQYVEGDDFFTEGHRLGSPKLVSLRQELEAQEQEVERLRAFKKERYELVDSLRQLKRESAEVSGAGAFTYDTQASDELRFHATAIGSGSATAFGSTSDDVDDDDQPSQPRLAVTGGAGGGVTADLIASLRAHQPPPATKGLKKKKVQFDGVKEEEKGREEDDDAQSSQLHRGLPSVEEVQALSAAIANLLGQDSLPSPTDIPTPGTRKRPATPEEATAAVGDATPWLVEFTPDMSEPPGQDRGDDDDDGDYSDDFED